MLLPSLLAAAIGAGDAMVYQLPLPALVPVRETYADAHWLPGDVGEWPPTGEMVPPRAEVATYAEAHWLRSDRGPVYSFPTDLRAPILPTCLAAAATDEEGRPITWVVLRTLVRRPSHNGWRHVVVVTDGEDVERYGRAEYVATCYVVQPGSGYSDLGVTWLERVEALHVFEVFCGAGE